jgi:glycosyltransferase involved in cell wall biosynthesis
MRIVQEQRSGLTFARERGVSESTGEIIVFCDDDNWLCPDYLAEAYALLSDNTNIAAVGGWGQVHSVGAIPTWFKDHAGFYACRPHAQTAQFVNQLIGAGLAIKRASLMDLKNAGFSSLLTDRAGTVLSSGGDSELSMALRVRGWRLFFSPKLQFGHFMPQCRLTEEYLLRLAKGIGQSRPVLAAYERALGIRPLWRTLIPVQVLALSAILRAKIYDWFDNPSASLNARVKRELLRGIGQGYASALIDKRLSSIKRQILGLMVSSAPRFKFSDYQ